MRLENFNWANVYKFLKTKNIVLSNYFTKFKNLLSCKNSTNKLILSLASATKHKQENYFQGYLKKEDITVCFCPAPMMLLR